MSVEMNAAEPLILCPTAAHKYTIILLHGRGRTANAFASELRPLQQTLPQAKFVFPLAPKRRATVYKKSLTRQWFDDWHLRPDLQSTDVIHARYDEGLQTSRLGETVTYLHALIAEEAHLVGGAQNVVLGGFSQGAAASMVAALLWEGEQRLGGVLAICAWLPYMSQMAELLEHSEDHGQLGSANGEEQDENEFDPFERPVSQKNEADRFIDKPQAVLEWLRLQIDLPKKGKLRRREDDGDAPVMFCHGVADEKVPPERSHKAADILPQLGLYSVERKTYAGVQHETSSEMIADLVAFLHLALGVKYI